MIEGIDVSKYQGTIDWQRVVDSGRVSFAFAKATQGTQWTDPQFYNNWKGIKSVGLVRGAYHFANPANDPVEEANNFLKVVSDYELEDLLVLDIETSNIMGPKFIQWVITWLETVSDATGKLPIVYTGGPFFNHQDGTPDQETIDKLSKYPLWLAAYTKSPNSFIPEIWKGIGWTFWQRSGDIAAPGDVVLKLPGITGAVDRNHFKGTLEELNEFVLNCYVAKKNILSDFITNLKAAIT